MRPTQLQFRLKQDLHLSGRSTYSSKCRRQVLNVSTQKSVITHARDKVSLFAAEQGIRAFAAKGKVEIQAQDDGARFFCTRGIQIISTEGRIGNQQSKRNCANGRWFTNQNQFKRCFCAVLQLNLRRKQDSIVLRVGRRLLKKK